MLAAQCLIIMYISVFIDTTILVLITIFNIIMTANIVLSLMSFVTA